MFQFPGFAPLAGWHAFSVPGCPIRTPADQPLFAGPRSFSQLTTSFFASESLGIPHAPFSTSSYARPRGRDFSCALLVSFPSPTCQWTWRPAFYRGTLRPHAPLCMGASCLSCRFCRPSPVREWRISESNRWPSACKADALANWAYGPTILIKFFEIFITFKYLNSVST